MFKKRNSDHHVYCTISVRVTELPLADLGVFWWGFFFFFRPFCPVISSKVGIFHNHVGFLVCTCLRQRQN